MLAWVNQPARIVSITYDRPFSTPPQLLLLLRTGGQSQRPALGSVTH
jgi:hypothetical protein